MPSSYQMGVLEMAIGERIRFFRNLCGMTQKYLGMKVGFSERTADIRMAQYESGVRTPKKDMTEQLAYVLGVSPMALDVPNIESDYNLIHTLFAIEDVYGLKPVKIDGVAYLVPDAQHTYKGNNLKKLYPNSLVQLITRWANEAEKLKNGEITQEEYDRWRYTFPEVDAAKHKERIESLYDSAPSDQYE